MPKLKKRKGGLSTRRKYYYRRKSDAYEKTEGHIWEFEVLGVETDDHLYAKTDMGARLIDTREDSDDSSSVRILEVEEEVIVETSFKGFAADIKYCVESRDYVFHESESHLMLLKLYEGEPPSVKLSVRINSDFTCQVNVHRKQLDPSHTIWNDMPSVFNRVSSVETLLDKLDSMTVCCGNPDINFHDLVPIGCGLSNSVEPEIVAYREGDCGAISSDNLPYSSTIRSTNCSMLTERKLNCIACSKYGYALNKRQKRLEERLKSNRTFIHTSYKHKDMTHNELCKKLTEQKNEIDNLQNTIWKLKRQYEKSSKVEGISVKDHKHKELSGLLSACNGKTLVYADIT